MTLNLSNGDLELSHARILMLDSSFIIESSRMTLSTRSHRMRLEDPLITPSTASSFQIRGHNATCTDNVCTLHEAAGSGCPHEPAGYSILSRKVVVHKSGDVDLSKPILELHHQPILALPWIRLRPEGKPGFSFPRLGYDPEGGLIAGPAGTLPVHRNLVLSGHAAIRSNQGFETRSKLQSPHLDFQVDQLYAHPDNHARLFAIAHPPLNKGNLALEVDLVTRDRTILDGMVETPTDRVTTHTSSRMLLSNQNRFLLFETGATMFQPFDAYGYLTQSVLTPTALITVDMPSAPVARFFWPSLSLQLKRQGLATKGIPLDAAYGPAHGHTRVMASPGVDTVFHAGPLQTSLRVATRHQVWLMDNQPGSQPATHSAAFHATLTLPLFRDFTTVRHIVNPYITYGLVPWLNGRSPNFVVDLYDSLRKGHGIEPGISTSLLGNKTSASLRIDIYERIELPGFSHPDGPQYLAVRGHVGSSFLQLSMDGAWDHRHTLPSFLGGTLAHYLGQTRILEFGARWLGPGNGPHREPSLNGGSSIWLQTPFATETSQQVEAFGETRIPVSRRSTLIMGARAALWPELVLHMAWYGFELQSACGCLSLGIMGSHRPSTPIPDIITSFTIRGF